jgi:hypothetical protein
MPSQGTDDPAIAALGRTLASIARSDFRLRDVLQSVVEEAARLCRADVADIAVRDGSVTGCRPSLVSRRSSGTGLVDRL